jgi:glutaredoxin 3
VLLFSTSTCSWCRREKRYFKEHGVPFKEINIDRDPDAGRDSVRKTGQRDVPVIKIGSSWVVASTGSGPIRSWLAKLRRLALIVPRHTGAFMAYPPLLYSLSPVYSFS